MALQGAMDKVGSPALQDKAGDWPLMPGERLVWTGRPQAFAPHARRLLARRITRAGLMALGGAFLASWPLALFWSAEYAANKGDVLPFSDWFVAGSVLAFCLVVLVLAWIVLAWTWAQVRLSRTRYAITDRRAIELCRHRGGSTAVRCLSWAAAGPRDSADPEGSVIIGETPVVGAAAVGALVMPESLTLEALGPARDAALAALRLHRERRPGAIEEADPPADPPDWAGAAIQGVIRDSQWLGTVVGMLILLFSFILPGIAVVSAGIVALFGYLPQPLTEYLNDRWAIELLLGGALILFVTSSLSTTIMLELRSDHGLRHSRRFTVAAGRATVVPAPPFGWAASCPTTPDMRIDLWMGRRPHVHFVDRVDESEGSKSLTRVGFDAPADPMGAYMALVTARDAAARAQSVHAGGT